MSKKSDPENIRITIEYAGDVPEGEKPPFERQVMRCRTLLAIAIGGDGDGQVFNAGPDLGAMQERVAAVYAGLTREVVRAVQRETIVEWQKAMEKRAQDAVVANAVLKEMNNPGMRNIRL